MENEELLLKSVSELVLKLFTVEELVEMGLKPTEFKWKFNNNINVIPILELYDNKGIYKTIESIEFPERLQKLLRETQIVGNTCDSKIDKHFLSYKKETAVNCNECEINDICPFKDDKE